MKKVLAVIVAGILLVSCLAACKGDEKVKSDSFDYLAANIADYIVLGEYKGLEIDMTPECTEEDIDNAITELLHENIIVNEITDRAAQNGDNVNIDFAGYVDGEQFAGGTAKGYFLVLGSNSFIDGFEAGLVGVMPGETVDLNLSFPEGYRNNPDLSGKPVLFKVTVNYIEETEYPEYNDEFVNTISEGKYTNTVDYSNYIRDTLNEQLVNQTAANKQGILMNMVRENTEIKDYPVDEYNANYDEFVNSYTSYATQYGMSLADFMRMFYGISEAEFYETAKKYAYDTVVQNLIIAAIAQSENISVTDEYYEERLVTLAKENNFDSAEALVTQYGAEYLRFYMVQEKVLDFVEDNSVVID
jgi:trigger factor